MLRLSLLAPALVDVIINIINNVFNIFVIKKDNIEFSNNFSWGGVATDSRTFCQS